MKKYIKPEIDICVVDIENSLMAASLLGEGDNTLNSIQVPGDAALSKDHAFSVWGNDDEE